MASLFDRSHYPALNESVYLNQASLGLVGRPATDAMHQVLDDTFRHGNLHMSDEQEVGFLETLRSRASSLVHAEPRRVAILSSASELLGQIPHILTPRRGSEVLAVGSDFPAITRPWIRLAEKGECTLHFVDDNPLTDLTDDLISHLHEATAVVVVGSVQYTTGTMIDTPRLRKATAAASIPLVVDATQGAGAMTTNTALWEADAVISSGYKWLGGHGGVAVGVLGDRFLDATPAMPGWMGAPEPFEFDARRLALAPDARRYTQSTMSYVSVVGLTAAIDQLLVASTEAIEDHAEHLRQLLIETLEPHGWAPFRYPDDPGASPHIVSLAHKSKDANAFHDSMRTRGIVCGSRGGRLRISLAPYNTEDDIQALVDALV